MENKQVLFDDWLEEYLENETDDYRDEYEREKFKLELAIQIKKIRTEQKLSQREFAEKVGIAQSTLANIEFGKLYHKGKELKNFLYTVPDRLDALKEHKIFKKMVSVQNIYEIRMDP